MLASWTSQRRKRTTDLTLPAWALASLSSSTLVGLAGMLLVGSGMETPPSHGACKGKMPILPDVHPSRPAPSLPSGTYALAFWYAGQLVGSGENTFDEVLKVGSQLAAPAAAVPDADWIKSKWAPWRIHHSFLWHLSAPGRPPLLTVPGWLCSASCPSVVSLGPITRPT